MTYRHFTIIYISTASSSSLKEMATETGADLENIVYYKEETHYFVMTAKKESLLAGGVLKEDIPDDEGPGGRAKILHPSNVDKEKLMDYAKKAALFATEYKSKKLPHTEFALIPRGEEHLSIIPPILHVQGSLVPLTVASSTSRTCTRRGWRPG